MMTSVWASDWSALCGRRNRGGAKDDECVGVSVDDEISTCACAWMHHDVRLLMMRADQELSKSKKPKVKSKT